MFKSVYISTVITPTHRRQGGEGKRKQTPKSFLQEKPAQSNSKLSV